MRVLGFICLLVAISGCKSADITAQPTGDSPAVLKSREIATQFGEAVLADNWKGAADLVAPAYRSKFTAKSLQSQYEKLVSQIKFTDPEFKPNGLEIGAGDLPTSVDDARGPYKIDPVPDRSAWLGWVRASIGVKKGDSVEQGVDAWILVIDDGGQPRIGHVNFEFLD